MLTVWSGMVGGLDFLNVVLVELQMFMINRHKVSLFNLCQLIII